VAFYKILFTALKWNWPGRVCFPCEAGVVILTNLLACCWLRGALVPFREKPSDFGSAKYLPHDWEAAWCCWAWYGSFELPGNIAGALIGGALAHELFRSKVHIGYVAAIVAASNAGAHGVSWAIQLRHVVDCWCFARASVRAVIGAAASLFVLGFPPLSTTEILADADARSYSCANRLGSYAVIGLILAFALVANVATNIKFPDTQIAFRLWTGCLDSNFGINRVSCAGLERNSTSVPQFHFSAISCVDRLYDAVEELRWHLGRQLSALDLCRLFSITFRSQHWRSSRVVTTGVFAYVVGLVAQLSGLDHHPVWRS